jgi:hypothetical protein
MAMIKVEFPGVEKATILVGENWKIVHHRLFYVSPEDADRHRSGGITAWHVCFVEDLLQLVNSIDELLLDVGWYPDADPSGAFRLMVVPIQAQEGKHRSPYDWNSPVVEFKTRSIDELLTEIHKIVSP